MYRPNLPGLPLLQSHFLPPIRPPAQIRKFLRKRGRGMKMVLNYAEFDSLFYLSQKILQLMLFKAENNEIKFKFLNFPPGGTKSTV